MRHVAEIPDIGFAAPVGLPPGLEVMTLADLRGRAAELAALARDAEVLPHMPKRVRFRSSSILVNRIRWLSSRVR